MRKIFILFVFLSIAQSIFAAGYSLIYNRQTDNRNSVNRIQTKKYYCKYCGKDYADPNLLSKDFCQKSPYGKHVLFKGYVEQGAKYYCKTCGNPFPTLKLMLDQQNCTPLQLTGGRELDLTNISNINPGELKSKRNNQKHIPFEGIVKRTNHKFICEKCGYISTNLKELLKKKCPSKRGYCTPLESSY